MEETDPHFEALLVYLKEARGFDFTGYKRSSLTRRVSRRMTQVGIADHQDYLDYLQVHPDEFTALFNTILINVTAFFRDTDAWDYLSKEILGPMVAAKPAGSPIRVWCAGCASGEEAYTIGMLVREAMEGLAELPRVQIFASPWRGGGATRRGSLRRSARSGSRGSSSARAGATRCRPSCARCASSRRTTSSRTRPSRDST